jgi:uncharacterized membrane protein YoaK (UPF0700 family)
VLGIKEGYAMNAQTRLWLTFLAGYCDTATFIHMGGIFSAHVTGNFVLFAASLSRGLGPNDYLKLITFPVFVLAVAVATFIYVGADKAKAKGVKTSGLVRVLGAVSLVLMLTTALSFVATPEVDVAITLLVVLAMGMQNALHHFIPGAMTTVMTGTVMNTVARLTKQRLGVPVEAAVASSVNTLWLIALFAAGCLIAGFATHHLGRAGYGYLSLALPAVMATVLWTLERRALGKAA